MFLNFCQYVKDLLNNCDFPDQIESQETWNRNVQSDPWMPEYFPDQFLTKEICNIAVQRKPCFLRIVPEHLKT